MTRYVLVGSGIAALSAAEAIRETDPRARITMVSREPHPFYSRPGLAYYITGELPDRKLQIRTRDDTLDLRINRMHAAAARIDVNKHELILEDRATVPYDRLLLAPGAASVLPEFEGSTLDGIVRLDGLDDARAIRRLARNARRAAVVGGGITAVELVEAFVAGRAETHYLMRSDRYWSRVFDSMEARLVESQLEAQGVRLHHHSAVARAYGRDGRLVAIETTAGERIECEALAIAVGVRPRTELARASGLHVERGIVTNEFLETSAEDVFAAGDAAEVADPAAGTSQLDTLWATAAAHGRAAGATMAGSPTAYARKPALNVTRLAGITTTVIGAVEGGGEDEDLVTITRGQSERWRCVPDSLSLRSEKNGNRVRVVLGRDRIVGAVVMGDQMLSRPLVHLISTGADASTLRSALREQPDRFGPLILDFWRRFEETSATVS